MTVNELIQELLDVVREKPERALYQVEDQMRHTLGWVRRGSPKDEANKIVAILPEVDI
jgi:hypothetical protein